jgi:cobyrinic acid a,c-diamide synthase
MPVELPRLVIAGLSGDSGKTMVSLSLLAYLRRKGLSISVFKKGPDYIDSAWLSHYSGVLCRNLDTYMVDPGKVYQTFLINASGKELAIIEGNRGLYDGRDKLGTDSTATLAKLTKSPVLLIVDCTKVTRTIAAIIHGVISFDSEIQISGIVLNRLAGPRHETIIMDAIDEYCQIPVVGCIPKLDISLIPGRHLGLIPPSEYKDADKLESELANIADKYLDVNNILKLAGEASLIENTADQSIANKNESDLRIGYFKDSIFTFYYPENLESLRDAGAELVPISSLTDKMPLDLDGLYIGGGFPETQAMELAKNRALMESVKEASENGMPIYAECGGLIYLSRSLAWQDSTFMMSGVFPIDLEMSPIPIGHGYTYAVVAKANPFFEQGAVIKGHEFHYTGIKGNIDSEIGCLKMEKGFGLGNGSDGLLKNRTMACYTHIHAYGASEWAMAMLKAAREYNLERQKKTEAAEINKSAVPAGI